MAYTIVINRGEVVRDADGKVVAPCQSVDDPDFRAYIAWVEAGNAPTEIVAPVEDPEAPTS